MGIFSKKQKVRIEEFCNEFYEKYIINPTIDKADVGHVFSEVILKDLVEADNNFVKVDIQKMSFEIMALRLELFSLAWLHQFGNKVAYEHAQVLQENKDNSKFIQDVFRSVFPAVAQSVFTKNYLQEKNLTNIWEAMENYNQTVARSTTISRTLEKAFDRVYLAKVNLSRANLFDLYHKREFDDKCVARALNRLFSEETWKRKVTHGLLVFTLCDRLGFGKDFEPSKEAQFRLMAVIQGFYDGARQALGKIEITT